MVALRRTLPSSPLPVSPPFLLDKLGEYARERGGGMECFVRWEMNGERDALKWLLMDSLFLVGGTGCFGWLFGWLVGWSVGGLV